MSTLSPRTCKHGGGAATTQPDLESGTSKEHRIDHYQKYSIRCLRSHFAVTVCATEIVNMGQSTTFYQISPQNFLYLEQRGIDDINLMPLTKTYYTLQGTFMALEFYLKKIIPLSEQFIIAELFNPDKHLFRKDLLEFDGYSPDMLEAVRLETAFPYLLPHTVEAAAGQLATITADHLLQLYNPEELNSKHIYPGFWGWYTRPGQANTEGSLAEDFDQMKSFFLEAARERDYVLAFTG